MVDARKNQNDLDAFDAYPDSTDLPDLGYYLSLGLKFSSASAVLHINCSVIYKSMILNMRSVISV